MRTVSLADDVRAIGLASGLDRIGFASAEPFAETRVALEQRKAAGLHGGMQFTYRNPARSTDPAAVLPTVRTLVVGARAYPATVVPPGADLRARGPLARVARYATAGHYDRLRDALDAVAAHLRLAGWSTRVVLDDNALVDRAAAARAGIGWYGKNANILIDGVGSWFVLGSVLTDAPLGVADHESGPATGTRPPGEGCGTCARCLTGCPTGAIVSPGVVDARRCLAWLVQAEGVFPREHRVALGDRLYGCDTCQEVCPPSARTERQETVDAPEASGAAPWVPLLEVLAASDEELLDRFGRWYIPRREPRYLRRNALLALANSATLPVSAAVRDAVARARADTDPLLRAHAVWAAKRLGLAELTLAGDGDTDPAVQDELAADVPARAGSSS